jgi:hypothetical protein
MSSEITIQLLPGGLTQEEVESLVAQLEGDGLQVNARGRYERRSVDAELNAIILAIVTIGVAVGQQALAELSLDALKKIVRRSLDLRPGDGQVFIRLIHETPNDELIINLPKIEDGDEVDAMIDGALLHARKSGRRTEIWYDRGTQAWETWEESVTRQVLADRANREKQ